MNYAPHIFSQQSYNILNAPQMCGSFYEKEIDFVSYYLNNPLQYVDKSGQWYEDVDYEWEWNITTNTWTQTGDKGGAHYHYVDIVDDWGRKLVDYEFSGTTWDLKSPPFFGQKNSHVKVF